MVIILAIAFPLIAWGAVWLKRRHDRKQDQINTGFNAGITGRGTDMTDHNVNK
jgi:high-affinity Fe2+/Pb2+ permease